MFNGNAIYDFTTNSGNWDFAYSWADTDPGGLGLAETKVSPIRTATPTRFAQWTLNLPSMPPDDGTTDAPNSAWLYAAPHGSTLAQQHLLSDVVVNGIVSHTFDSLATSGVGPQLVSGFASRTSTAQGKIVSGGVDALGAPLIQIEASGKMRAPKFLQSGDVIVPNVPAGTTATTYDLTFPVPYDTAPTVIAMARSSRPDLIRASAGVATTTGVTIYVIRTSGSTADVAVNWEASYAK
jgi:hypothetical protein